MAGNATVAPVQVGAAAVHIAAANGQRDSLTLLCPTTNTGIVYFGFAATVTADQTATGGIPRHAGESITFTDGDSAGDLWAIADTPAQYVLGAYHTVG